jgi:PLP dependent protein
MTISDRVARVRERIEAACRRAGRRPEDVRLIAVSKTFSSDQIREAYATGLREFAENRVQEAEAKLPELAGLDITWHLVGHLQGNKAARARPLFQWIQSIDSVRVARKLNDSAGSKARMPVLLQVNLGHEPTKYGLGESELARAAEDVASLEHLEVCGLMLIPPFSEDPEGSRPFFRRLRELASEIQAARLPGVSMNELSMGMSHDFEVAIEEGATMVRVGTAIFGER